MKQRRVVSWGKKILKLFFNNVLLSSKFPLNVTRLLTQIQSYQFSESTKVTGGQISHPHAQAAGENKHMTAVA